VEQSQGNCPEGTYPGYLSVSLKHFQLWDMPSCPCLRATMFQTSSDLVGHWFDVAERVPYKLGVAVYWCLHHTAPQYLVDTLASDFTSRQRLRSSSRHELDVPHQKLSTLGHRSFLIAGPMVWISLPVTFRDPARDINTFNGVGPPFRRSLFRQC